MADETNDTPRGVGLTIDLSNVITFPSLKELRDSGGPVTRVPRTYQECEHGSHGVRVSENDRIVECKRCKKNIDAFDALLSLTRYWDWERTRDAKKHAHEESKRVAEELDRLKKLRSKEKAAVSIPGKFVRKALKNLSEGLKRNAASCTSRGDKAGASAYERAADHVRSLADELVGHLAEIEEDDHV